MIRHTLMLSTLCAALSLGFPARGDVMPIEPFQGALSENFDSMRG